MTGFELTGHSVLVTGARGGLGKAIADGLNDLGARVYGSARDSGAADELAAAYASAPVVLDVDAIEHFDDVASRLIDEDPQLDLLVNNAGINVPQSVLDVDAASFDAVMSTNLRGPFFLAQAFARNWIRRGMSGAIVNVGSQAAMVGIESRSVYGASKAGIHQFTKVMAIELAQAGIRVNAVAPTFIRTEMTATTLDDPAQGPGFLARIPLGRFGTPEDVVGGVAYLLGDRASLVTGTTLVIDGGYTSI